MREAMSLLLLCAAVIASATACTETQEDAARVADSIPAAAASSRPELTAEERKLYRDIASTAWAYLDTYYKPATGFVNATPDWANTTIWDIGGQLLAFRSA